MNYTENLLKILMLSALVLPLFAQESEMIDIVSKTLKKMEINFEETRYGRIRINSLDA